MAHIAWRSAHFSLGVVDDDLADEADDGDDEDDLENSLHGPNLVEGTGGAPAAQHGRGDSIGSVLAVVLAHGSGIDDVLWFAVPVVVALFVLRRAERRARKSTSEQESVD